MDITSLLRSLSVAVVPIIVAITFHEVAHGYVAYRLGDPTAKMMGRLTLNPLAHVDPFGTILMPLALFILSNGAFIFGSAKPVPVNFLNLRNPRRDGALVAAAGPGANILIAALSVVLFAAAARFFSGGDGAGPYARGLAAPVMKMLQYSIVFNIFIAAFNLIPVPPLDGGRIMVGLLPQRQAMALSRVEPYGMLVVLLLWVTGLANYLIMPLQALVRFLVGLVIMPIQGLM
jgi:Zn-dependent protease